jgi:hypothetical protein
MSNSSVALVPLSVVFALAMSACCGKNSTTEYTETLTLTDAELIEMLTDAPSDSDTDGPDDTDASDTDDTDAGDTDTSPAEVPEHTCEEVCSHHFGSYNLLKCTETSDDSAEGANSFTCDMLSVCVGGRFHEVVDTSQRAQGSSMLGAWLAQMAHDEAASAAAFAALEMELRAHGASVELRRRLLEAAADEVRHASMIRELAEPRGGVVPPTIIGEVAPRDLFTIAKENVVEGCVQETWLAMRAHVQANAATDPQIAAALAVIAVDETRHAELAREMDRWMRSKLSAADNRRLDTARDKAVERLTSRIDLGNEMRFVEAGLPSAAEEARLVRALTAALWT